MKAIQIRITQKGPSLFATEMPEPKPGEGDILIRVYAAGVTPTELLWYPTMHTKDGAMRIDAVPGHEFSGVVAALGKSVRGFQVGDQVYGMNDWFADGATAEFCISQPRSIARKPASLTYEAAAAVPIGALTAWQGLLERAKIKPGERVLIHGGAGGVGVWAVQLAHLHGAYVMATVSARNLDFVRQLGADKGIDYQAAPFEEQVGKVDVVFDTVGGDTLKRSWNVLKPGGRMVTIAADGESTRDQRTKDAFFIVEPRHDQLAKVAELLDAGQLKVFVNDIVPLDQAPAAYRGTTKNKQGHGKVVIAVSA